MSEYGIDSPDRITWGWTPAQALLMAEMIRRRRARETIASLHETFLVTAAAQGSKVHFRQLQTEQRKLRQEAGFASEDEMQGLVRSLGVKVLRSSARGLPQRSEQ